MTETVRVGVEKSRVDMKSQRPHFSFVTLFMCTWDLLILLCMLSVLYLFLYQRCFQIVLRISAYPWLVN